MVPLSLFLCTYLGEQKLPLRIKDLCSRKLPITTYWDGIKRSI